MACCAAEMMVKAYMTSYKLPCIITRGNNVYGPHQFPEKLVPKFTLLARRGEALPVHGAGQVHDPFSQAHLLYSGPARHTMCKGTDGCPACQGLWMCLQHTGLPLY